MKRLLFTLLFLAFAVQAQAVTRYIIPAAGGTGCTNGATTYDPAGAGACGAGSATVYVNTDTTQAIEATFPGDTLIFRAGTYSDVNSNKTIFRNGTSFSDAPIFKAHTGEAVVLSDSSGTGFAAPSDRGQSEIKYLIFDGFQFRGGSSTAVLGWWGAAHHIRIQNCDITSAHAGFRSGIDMQPGGGGGGFNEIINCEIYENGSTTNTAQPVGIGGYIATNNNLFDRVTVRDNAYIGIQFYCSVCSGGNVTSGNRMTRSHFFNNETNPNFNGQDFISYGTNQVDGNLFHDTFHGLHIRRGTIAFNNTIYNGAGTGIVINTGTGTNTVKNNIIRNFSTSINNLATSVISNNHCSHSTPTGCSNTDPGMVNPAAGNFNLSTNSSAAVDAGTASIASGVTRAFNGSAPDIGAHEVIGLSAFEATGANTINLDFQMNVNQPLLPATAIAGLSCREDTNALTITGAVRSGNARIIVTVSNTLNGADVIDCSYSTGTGNVTDSNLIGNLKNQRLNAFTNVSVTNSISGGGAATMAQSRFEFYLLQGATDTEWVPICRKRGVPGDCENVNVKMPPGAKFILRVKLRCQNGDCAAFNPRLRFDLNGAASYTAIPAAFAAANIKALGTGTQPGTVLGEGASLTQDLLTSDETTNVACVFVRTATSIPNLDLSQNSEAECAWAIEFDTDATTLYDFRVYTDAGAALDSYTVTPRVTIGKHRAFR